MIRSALTVQCCHQHLNRDTYGAFHLAWKLDFQESNDDVTFDLMENPEETERQKSWIIKMDPPTVVISSAHQYQLITALHVIVWALKQCNNILLLHSTSF